MNKNIITYAFIAIVAVLPTAVFADNTPAPSTAPSVATVPPSTTGSASTVPPSTSGSVSTVPPSTSGSVSTVPPSTIGSVSTVPPSTIGSVSTVPASTGSNNTGGSTGGGSSSSVSHSSSGSYVGYSGSSGYAIYTGCPLITTYMKIGAANDVAQVTKLQNFLKNVEKINVVVTGTYDVQTVNAVKAFQNKYPATIMGPWGIAEATGNVYITTTKKINQIACNQPLTLNPSELALINTGKNAIASADAKPTVSAPTVNVDTDSDNSSIIPVRQTLDRNATSSVNADNSTETGAVNTASVGKASILTRFWNFILFLFK